MMSYLQQLRQSKDKASVAYQEFALSTKNFKNHLFCFFEGSDNPYYVPRIKKYTDNILPINCGGREKVLETYELIKNQEVYNEYSKAFFIDRDFNQPLGDKNFIFETPCYSIENLYVNENTFREILIHEFHLSQNDTSFNTCISLFKDRFKEFNSSVAIFNSWYACLIDIRNEKQIQTGVQLGEKLPERFVFIKLHNVSQNYDLEKIKKEFPDSTIVEDEKFENKLSEFKNCDSEIIFRGKYQMEFLINLIQLIIDDSKKLASLIGEKINFAFDGALNHKRALSIFSSYAKTPDSLNDFLKTVTKS
jgi:hypothetical protein